MTATKTEYFRRLLEQNDVLLAPLAGVTDAAFRSLCIRYGATGAVTEMVSAKGLMYENENTASLMKLAENEKNTGIQIFGADGYFLSEAVKRYLNETDFAFIDINMGCPVRKVTSNGEGSALLADPKKVYEVASAVVKASEKPVSAKIRTGLDKTAINCAENSKALEDAGVNMITVHGRTKAALYSGKADLEAIKTAAEAVKIPVIGNGDVFSYESYKNMKSVTGCAGVMVARGAMGNPFIFEEILCGKSGKSYAPPSVNRKLNTALEHFELLIAFKGEDVACREFRKQLCWYTKGMSGGAALRGRVSALNCKKDIVTAVKGLLH